MSVRTRWPCSDREDAAVFLVVVENAPGPADHAGERVLVDVNGEPRFLGEENVEPTDERTATRHDDATVDDVAGELRRCDLERPTDGVDDLLDRLLNRLADLRGVHTHRFR